MKRTLKTFTVSLILALIAFPAFAQMGGGRPHPKGNNRPERPVGQRMDMLANVPAEVRTDIHIAVFDEYLKLSEEQKTKLAKIDAEFAEKHEALRNDPMRGDRKRIAMRDLQNEHQLAIHDLLTKKQYSIYLEKKEAIQTKIHTKMRDYLANN